jgi:hypothetical protein
MLKPPVNGSLSNKIFLESLDTPVFVKMGKVLQKQPRSSYWSAAWASYTYVCKNWVMHPAEWPNTNHVAQRIVISSSETDHS